jgi:PAS domain S-box-containing protein
MPSPLSQFERHQLDVIARVTPHAMGGHVLNTTVLVVALAGSIPTAELVVWGSCSYAIALVVLYRHFANRGRVPRSFRHAANRATVYALLLALPWATMGVLHLGALAPGEELILVALGAGMAASGTILLSAVPVAAYAYMSGILVPSAVKCLAAFDQKGYLLLAVLAASYWWFLSALIGKITREIKERKQADIALNESEARLQEALMAGHVVAFTWDPRSGLSQRSQNTPHILGLQSKAGTDRQGTDFLARVHADDRKCFAAQIKGLRPENSSYSASFRFIRPDGQEVWLEETGRAEFDADGQFLRLRGLTRDITEHKQAEERQRLLVRELDHRVKNALASVAAVAQRARQGSGSIDDFLQAFDGRIQSMANAHAMLSRSQWQGVSLADLVRNELAPYVGGRSASVEGPDVLLTAESTQPMAIVLHELVTNASKYGALATAHGHVSVRWNWQQDGRTPRWLLLEWIEETHGPAIAAPSQVGYGVRAIRNLIPYELGGTVDLVFDAGGVHCRMELPSKRIRSGTQPVDLLRAAPNSMPAARQPIALPV